MFRKYFPTVLSAIVLALILMFGPQAFAQHSASSASPSSHDVYEINNLTPGATKTFLGTRLRGPLQTGTTSGDLSAIGSANADGQVTTAVYRVTTGSTTGASLTLDDGYQDQVVTFVLETDGGQDFILHPDTKTGFSTVTLSDAGESVTLRYINDTVGWVIQGDRPINTYEGSTAVSACTAGTSCDDSSTVTSGVIVATTGATSGQSLQFPDGNEGQEVTVVLATDGGQNLRIHPATTTGYSYVDLDDANDSASFRFTDDYGWVLTGMNGASVN